jgi:hypothetical protein
MIDLQTRIERLEIRAAECGLIAEVTTDNAKRELFLRLALNYRDLADETHKLTTAKDAD